MNNEDIIAAVNKCENREQVAGLLSTQDLTKEHPEVALHWVEAITRRFGAIY